MGDAFHYALANRLIDPKARFVSMEQPGLLKRAWGWVTGLFVQPEPEPAPEPRRPRRRAPPAPAAPVELAPPAPPPESAQPEAPPPPAPAEGDKG